MVDRLVLRDVHGVRLAMLEVLEEGSAFATSFLVESPWGPSQTFETRAAAEEAWFGEMSKASMPPGGAASESTIRR